MATPGRLTLIWSSRYRVDLSAACVSADPKILDDVIESATASGKAFTTQKILHKLEVQTEMSGILANKLLCNIVDLAESRRLAKVLSQVYGRVLELYQQETLPADFAVKRQPVDGPISEQVASAIAMPSLGVMEIALRPALENFRNAQNSTSDPRMGGFLTTLFHFTNNNLLALLSEAEQILLAPYLKFVEEHVCIPWQQICRTAALHFADSPPLMVVAKLMPQSHAISLEVYQQLQQKYPAYRSRRGRLVHDGVKRSTLRDFEMIQAYLHLCLLADSVESVRKTLLPLCLMVFPNVDVGWDLVESSFPILLDAIVKRLEPSEVAILLPIFDAIQSLFSQENPQVQQALQVVHKSL